MVKKQSSATAIIVIFNSIAGFPFIVASERKTTKRIGISSNTAKMKHARRGPTTDRQHMCNHRSTLMKVMMYAVLATKYVALASPVASIVL